MPKRIQRKRTPGWRMPEGAVYVGRPSRWGNPFEVDLIGRDIAVSMFRDQMIGFFSPFPLAHLSDEQFRRVYSARDKWIKRMGCGFDFQMAARSELRGRDLACWCPLTLPDGSHCPCHADVLLEIANA